MQLYNLSYQVTLTLIRCSTGAPVTKENSRLYSTWYEGTHLQGILYD